MKNKIKIKKIFRFFFFVVPFAQTTDSSSTNLHNESDWNPGTGTKRKTKNHPPLDRDFNLLSFSFSVRTYILFE